MHLSIYLCIYVSIYPVQRLFYDRGSAALHSVMALDLRLAVFIRHTVSVSVCLSPASEIRCCVTLCSSCLWLVCDRKFRNNGVI